ARIRRRVVDRRALVCAAARFARGRGLPEEFERVERLRGGAARFATATVRTTLTPTSGTNRAGQRFGVLYPANI
ncbi:MAG: hypothetical protein WB770_04485, partial [Acidimicrobiales bacterium]